MVTLEEPSIPSSAGNLVLLLSACVTSAMMCLIAAQAVHMTSAILATIAFSTQVLNCEQILISRAAAKLRSGNYQRLQLQISKVGSIGSRAQYI